MSSAPPPSSAPPGGGLREYALEIEPSRSWGRRRGVEGMLRLSALGLVIECEDVMLEPLRVPLGTLQIGAVDGGPARPGGLAGRFAVLRRLGPNAVVPRSEGIEGWLWTTLGGSAYTSLGDQEEAPNVALLFTKPLAEDTVVSAFRPDFLAALAERSPLGTPAVAGLLLRVADTLLAERVFKQFGLLRPLTDREVPPTKRRSLPTDQSADPVLRGREDARAATSVAPPGAA